MRSKHLLPLIAIALILAMVLAAGCTSLNGSSSGSTSGTRSSGDSYTSNGGGSQYVPQVAPMPADYSLGSKSSGYPTSYESTAPTQTSTTGTYADLGNRKVIMTAYMQIETRNFNESVDKVRALALGAGGYVQSSSMSLYGDNRKTSTITIKVPQSAYESTLSEIRKMGTVKSDSSSGSDVTMQYVDLQSRLKNLKTEESRLTDIMAMAKNVSEVLAVEKELSRVQGEIESAQAQMNVLNSQIDYSTITVYITEPEPIVSYDWGIGNAFTEAVHAFVGMIGGLIVLTGYLIPLALYFVLAIAVIYVLIRGALWLYNRSKQRKTKAAAPPEEKK